MAIYNWSELIDGQSVSFDPATDILHFDVQVSAAELLLGLAAGSLSFSHGGKSVTLLSAPESFGTSSVTFANGSVLAIGDSASNSLLGTAENDHLLGLSGNDTLYGSDGDDVLDGGAGNDLIDDGEDEGGENLLVLPGGDGNGNDTLIGGDGVDTLKGGSGANVYIVDADDVIVDDSSFPGGAGVSGLGDAIIAAINYSLQNLPDIEHLTLAGTGNFKGTGNSGNNRLTGNSGENTLRGLAGDDTLDGGGNIDSMVGGDGDDVYKVGNVNDIVVETASDSGSAGSPGALATGGIGDSVIAAIDYALDNLDLAYVENITLTGNADEAIGNALDNVLTGNGDADRLVGMTGDDTLDGGGGNDNMAGNGGNDVFIVDSASDVTTESLNKGTDTVRSSVSLTLDDNIENLTLTGTGDINGNGNTLDNTVTGNSGDNSLTGGGGQDKFFGGDGNDTLKWGADDLKFRGGDGTDTLRVSAAGATLDLTAVGDTVILDVEKVRLDGAGQTVKLALADVLAINTLDQLRVDGSSDDTVRRGAGWTQGADQVIDGTTYYTYTQGSAVLLVDTEMASLV